MYHACEVKGNTIYWLKLWFSPCKKEKKKRLSDYGLSSLSSVTISVENNYAFTVKIPLQYVEIF